MLGIEASRRKSPFQWSFPLPPASYHCLKWWYPGGTATQVTLNNTRADLTVHLERAVLVSVALPQRPWIGADPLDELRGLAELGCYGVAVPTEWDGAGLDYLALAVILEEIAAGDGATSTVVSVNN